METGQDLKHVEICEDLWSALPPSTFHALAGATVIANLSASDETVGKAEYRRALVANQSARLLCGYLYASAGHGDGPPRGPGAFAVPLRQLALP